MSDIASPVKPVQRELSPAVVAGAALIALGVAMGIGRFAFTPLLPMMQLDAGLTLVDSGWLASANYAGYLAGALLAMGLRMRSSLAIRGGLPAIAVTTFAMALDHSFLAWMAWRALAGIASAWVFVHVSVASLHRLAALGRPRLASVVYAGVGAGIAVAGVLCLPLMRAGASSDAAWITLGALAALFTLLIWPVFGASDEGPATPRGHTRLEWDADRVRLVLCYGTFGFGYIIPATFLPAMARQVVHDPALFGWSWPLFGAAAFGSTLAAATLQRFMTHRQLWLAGQLAMALGVMLPLWSPGIAGILLAALIVGGTFMVITLAAIQEARRIAGAHAAALIGAMTAAFAAGQIAGPLLVSGAAHAGADFSLALPVAAALLVASTLALRRAPRRHAHSDLIPPFALSLSKGGPESSVCRGAASVRASTS